VDWITDNIAIGNYLDARNEELLSTQKIASILSLDGGLAGIEPKKLGVRRIEIRKLHDGAENHPEAFLSTLRVLHKLVLESPPVMVQCHAGRSRSIILVAGFLMMTHGLTSKQAIEQVASKREIGITPGIEKLLDYIV